MIIKWSTRSRRIAGARVFVAVSILAPGCGPKADGATQSSSSAQTESASSLDPTGAQVTTAAASTGERTSGTTVPTGGGSTTDAGDTQDSVATSTGDIMASCDGGMKLVQSQAEGFIAGIERCPQIGAHRDEAVLCKVVPEVSSCEPGKCADGCDAFDPGACSEASPGYCACIYPCSIDADCGANAACLCGTNGDFIFGTGCRPATCLTDADCGAFTCGVSPSICGNGDSLHCRTAEDDCKVDADCQPETNRCAFATDLGRWTCSTYANCD